MPLIDLQTDLKSLRYGKDTPGGGYSGQPYIQAKIPDGLEPKSPDFILRGGYLTVGDSLTDIKRLTKMFFDLKSPNGLFFIAKQNVLSNSAARTQTSGVMNEGIYTPLNTLAQAGVIAFGGHLNKQGINPFAQTGAYAVGDGLYNSVVKPSQPLTENRLVQIYNSIKENRVIELKGFKFNEGGINVLTYKGGPGAPLGIGNTNIRFADQRVNNAPNNPLTWTPKQNNPDSLKYLKNVNNKGVSGTYTTLTSGSSASVLKSFYNTEGQLGAYYNFSVYEPIIPNNTWPTNSNLTNAQYTYTYNQKDIIDTEINDGKLAGRPSLQDFRKILRASLPTHKGVGDGGAENAKRTGATPNTPDYNSGKAYENRVNIGSKNSLGPGNSTNKNLVSYTAGSGIGPVDLINALPIYRSENVAQNSQDYPVNDLVKFRIAAIDSSSPNFKTFMHFRAFIDSFNDNYNASWGSVKYLGRGENFYNYNGFDRTISLSFTVAAQSKQELIPMYKKLNYLASNLTPDYSPFGYMRGPLVQLTVGGYLYEQPGFISSITYDIPQDTTWEIGINDQGNNDPTVKELPHRINVSNFNFTPIHNFVPSKQGLDFVNGRGKVNEYGRQRFIALSAGGLTNYDKDFVEPTEEEIRNQEQEEQLAFNLGEFNI